MSRHTLNRRAFEHAKALIASGRYADDKWSFEAEDSNAILGDKGRENWPSYAQWFLGIDDTADKATKAAYAYPYGKGETLSLAALRAIISRAAANNDGAIRDAAQELLAAAEAKDADRSSSSGDAAASQISNLKSDASYDVYMTGGPVDIKADLSGPVAADGQPSLHRFQMVAYTGGPMMLKGGRKDIDYRHPIVIDLDGVGGIDKNRPILRDHDQRLPVGHSETLTASGGVLTASGVISNPASPQAMEVVTSSKNKFPWQASIGANIVKHEFVPAGGSASANGRTFDGPVTIARKWVLGEISFVALGADDSTSAVVASRTEAKESKEKAMKFKAWAKAKGFTDSELEGKMCAGLRATYRCSWDYDESDPDGQEPEEKGKGKATKAARTLDIAASATASGGDTASAGVAEIQAEHLRCNAINDACQPAIQAAGSNATLVTQLSDIRSQAIQEHWDAARTATQVELATLRASRGPIAHTPGQPFNINTGGRGLMLTSDVLASAVSLSAGIPERIAMTGRTGRPLSEQEANRVMEKDIRGIGLQRLMGFVAMAHGMSLPPGSFTDAEASRVMALEEQLAQASRVLEIQGAGGQDGYSTISLLGITENIMNKSMLMAYGDVDSVVEDICWQHDTNDFKIFKAYRMTASGRMQLVNDTGELKSIGLQDESYANQLQTRGCVITIGRQTIINDDMGALTQQPQALGREAAMTREEVVFGTYLAGLTTLFPVNGAAGNYLGALPLGIAGMTRAVQQFREQVDANKRPIKLKPDRVLVAPALEESANRLYKPREIVVTGLASTGAKSIEGNANSHVGLYRPIVSEFLANRGGTGLPGSSDTGWTLLCNPSSGFAVVQIGYLRGARTPIIERGEAPFSTLGMHMRCYYDFGVALHDPRSGQYSAGA